MLIKESLAVVDLKEKLVLVDDLRRLNNLMDTNMIIMAKHLDAKKTRLSIILGTSSDTPIIIDDDVA